jgi:hypothetical protein
VATHGILTVVRFPKPESNSSDAAKAVGQSRK